MYSGNMDPFEQACEDLINIAQQRIADEYDGGRPNYRAYHNSNHTQSVINATVELCKHANTPHRKASLCKLAAAYHDVVHNGDSDPANEQLSADFATTMMKTSKLFTAQDVKHVQHMILATKCTQKYPKIIQSPPSHDYESKLLCDADLASFGKPYDEFYASAMNYFYELHGQDASDEELRKYKYIERTLLQNHSFWTEEANSLYPHAPENYRRLTHDLG